MIGALFVWQAFRRRLVAFPFLNGMKVGTVGNTSVA
jgi:hypothetical protein